MRLHIHGVHVPNRKNTAELAALRLPIPETVEIPMSMHIGAPAEPVVKKGDQVCVGSLIGKAGGFVSANIYSSVSGTVEGVAPFRMVNGSTCQAVAIAADGQQTVDPACVPPVVTDNGSCAGLRSGWPWRRRFPDACQAGSRGH